MKKIEKRAIMCLLLAGVLVLGLGIFCFRLVKDGGDWATFVSNKNIYNDSGKLTAGTLYDSEGKEIMSNVGGEMSFSDDAGTRKALVHVTGDPDGNISTGANKAYADKLAGYNLITGTYSITGQGRDVYLTLNADVCKAANEALAGRSGTVGVYNYETGEIVCLVSSPNYDPYYPPSVSEDDKSGIYINRFFSASFSPGSIFKLVTAAAAIENKSDYSTWTYTCTGSIDYGNGDEVTCMAAHGTVDLQQALSDSCNCYFGALAEELGPDIMNEYVEKTGLTESYEIDGITVAEGSFEFPESGINLAWAGIGQYHDQVNPCTMMMYMGAIANEGQAVMPRLIDSVKFNFTGLPAGFTKKGRDISMIDAETAGLLKDMMRYNVEDNYGENNFPGLNICAKSGTAEVGAGQQPNAWFAGFLDDPEYPYAFIVLVENGGSGSTVAGNVANKVLQTVVTEY